MTTPPPQRHLRDPRELRAMAHPVRIAIIEQLTLGGPLTATQLADRLDESPANCSWHLRKLADHGFVEEAEGGKGRQRPWQMVQVGFTWSDADAGPEERLAGEALSRMVLERQVDRASASRAQLVAEGADDWMRAASFSESGSWLTVEELEEANAEILEVMQRFADRIQDPSRRPPGSRLCEFVSWGLPIHVPGVDPMPEADQGGESA